MRHTISWAVALAAIAFSSPGAHAQSILTKIDLNPLISGKSSTPFASTQDNQVPTFAQFTKVGQNFYVTADLEAHGRELYRIDSATGTAVLLKDIFGGPSDAEISEFVEFNGKLFFQAREHDGTSILWGGAVVLWVSDGTEAGTEVFDEFGSNGPYLHAKQFFTSGSELFFVAEAPGELHVSDGTATGTHAIAGASFPNSAKSFTHFAAHPSGTGVLFSAENGGPGAKGFELWESDGTSAGTQLVADIWPGTNSSNPTDLMTLGNRVIFSATGQATGTELYVTDGTPGGTLLLADIAPGSASSNPEIATYGVAGNQLYFSASNPATGRELYVTDGTPAGTTLVVDALPGPLGSDPIPLGAINGQLIVSATVQSGAEPYVLIGSSLTLLKDINTASPDASSNPTDALVIGNKLYFTCEIQGSEISLNIGLWCTDGTPAGTQHVFYYYSDQPAALTPIDSNRFLFSGRSQAAGGEVFISDGTTAGTHVFANLNPEFSSQSGYPVDITVINGSELIFSTGPPPHNQGSGLTLWSKATGAVDLIGDWSVHYDSVFFKPQRRFSPLWVAGQQSVFFVAEFPDPYLALMDTDGTKAGTVVVSDFGKTATDIYVLGAVNGQLFLNVGDAVHGTELWISDGTEAGTALLKDIAPGPVGSSIDDAVSWNGELYFAASDGVSGLELWKSDGTTAGTVQVAEINPTGSSELVELVALKDRLFFLATDGVHGLEPWGSDGTAAGTVMVADVKPGPTSSLAQNITFAGDKAFFFATPNLNLLIPDKSDLWESDGTVAGTQMVANLHMATGELIDTVWFKGNLLFTLHDSFGKELWKYDGSWAGLLADISPGHSSEPRQFVVCGDLVYFSAKGPQINRELYVTDGTTAGTSLVVDINPGIWGSGVWETVLAGGDLFFRAAAADNDYELYRYSMPGAHTTDLGFGHDGALLSASTPAIGTSLQFDVQAPTGANLSLLVMSPPTAPSSAFTVFEDASWINPASFYLLGWNTLPNWSITIPIPAAQSLIGVQVNAQAFFPPAGSFPAKTSNGLRLVLGN